jgi:hypothetical protein
MHITSLQCKCAVRDVQCVYNKATAIVHATAIGTLPVEDSVPWPCTLQLLYWYMAVYWSWIAVALLYLYYSLLCKYTQYRAHNKYNI